MSVTAGSAIRPLAVLRDLALIVTDRKAAIVSLLVLCDLASIVLQSPGFSSYSLTGFRPFWTSLPLRGFSASLEAFLTFSI